MSSPSPLSLVPFVSVDDMMRLVAETGVERFLVELAGYIEADFRRWPQFDKTPRVAAHAVDGSIELMPTSDGAFYAIQICQRPSQERPRRAGRRYARSAASPMSPPAIRCC